MSIESLLSTSSLILCNTGIVLRVKQKITQKCFIANFCHQKKNPYKNKHPLPIKPHILPTEKDEWTYFNFF